MNVHIIRTDGAEEHVELPRGAIKKAINADGLDSVSLRDGRIMMVDDLGHSRQRPVNPKATALYHSVCKPGTMWQIVGDVAIVVDR